MLLEPSEKFEAASQLHIQLDLEHESGHNADHAVVDVERADIEFRKLKNLVTKEESDADLENEDVNALAQAIDVFDR